MRILIDGDVVAHTVAARVGGRVDLPDLADQVEAMIEDWARCGDAGDDIVVCLSEGRSFRYWVWPRYKEGRKGKPRPPMLDDAYAVLRGEYDCWSVPGLEGDDCLGILGTEPARGETSPPVVIVTIDKDLLQVPGLHFNPARDDGIRAISPDEACWYFHYQWLMGDSGDDLPGIPGVGPKRAVRILEGLDGKDLAAIRERVLAAYAEADLSDEYCRQMERCVRVLTRRDYAE